MPVYTPVNTRPSSAARHGDRPHVRTSEPSVVFCLQNPRTGQVEYTRPGQRPSWAR